ncbi:MAG: hypothetical protein WA139_02680 [Candidatus Aenigmatarchaeota archaeon]
MRLLLRRALNANQSLILSEIRDSNNKTITGTLNRISKERGVSLSTLKLNAKILRELGLISYCEFHTVELTDFGKAIIKMLR